MTRSVARPLIVAVATAGLGWLQSTVALADNCSGLSDCSVAVKIALVLLAIVLVLLLWELLVPLAAEAGAAAAGELEFGFASEELLISHFEKHAAEFGYSTIEEYLAGANRLFAGGEDIATFVRANGDTLFYDLAENEFGVVTEEGVIRTFFKPVEDLAYWLAQVAKG